MGLFRRKKKNRFIEPGYLHPDYWRCIVCQQKAIYAIRPALFMIGIKKEEFFKELEPDQRKSVIAYAEFIGHPQGALLERPEGTEHLEDTSGLARGRGGMGFDAVFLCENHSDGVSKAIEASAK